MSGWKRALVGLTLIIGAFQVAVGVVWWFANLSAVPAYGDTVEYLRLSDTLQVDEYRTLAYPLAVRLSREIAAWAHIPWQVPLYLAQSALAMVAAWYVIRSAAPRMARPAVAAATAVVVTSPLVLHYASVVLTDSFASSLLVITLAGLARVVVRADHAKRTVAVTATAALGATLMRSEKVAVLLASGCALLLLLAWAGWRRRTWARGRLRAAALPVLLAVLLPAFLGGLVNRATQTANPDRPPAGVVTIAFSQIVWPHLTQIRDELPSPAATAITEADARAFDGDANAVFAMLGRMRQLDGGGDRIIQAAMRSALRCCAVSTVIDVGGNTMEYALTPVTFAVETPTTYLFGVPAGSPTLWDVTRMAMATPFLTKALLATSFVLLPLLAMAAFVRRSSRAEPPRTASPDAGILAIVWLGAAINGCVFAVIVGGDANVRYGISSSMVMVAAVAAAVLSGDRDVAAEHVLLGRWVRRWSGTPESGVR